MMSSAAYRFVTALKAKCTACAEAQSMSAMPFLSHARVSLIYRKLFGMWEEVTKRQRGLTCESRKDAEAYSGISNTADTASEEYSNILVPEQITSGRICQNKKRNKSERVYWRKVSSRVLNQVESSESLVTPSGKSRVLALTRAYRM